MITLLEAYLAAHGLLLVGAAVIGKLGGRPRRRLLLARVALLSCVVAPLVMMSVEPRWHALMEGASALEGGEHPATSALSEAPKTSPLRALAMTAKSRGPSLVDATALWLWILCGLGGAWHLGRLTIDFVRIRRTLRPGLSLRRHGRVRVLILDTCEVPFSVRLLRYAYVAVPSSIVLLPRALRIAVAHEAQHHRQGDCVFAYVVEGLRAAFFLNPGIHRWCRILSEFQEYSCDEALIGRQLFSPHDYGRCLYEVARAAHQAPRSSGRELAAARCIVGMAQGAGDPTNSSELRRRIVMLGSYQSAAPQRRWARGFALMLAIGLPFGAAYGMRGALTGATFAPLDTSRLDPALQAVAEREVRTGLERSHARSAAIVVASPETGRILAFAEARSDAVTTAEESWATRAFAPGSTLKPFVIAAALDAGVTTADRSYDCRGPLDVAGVPFANAEEAKGPVSTTDTLVDSVNVGAIKIAQDLGPARLREAFRRFGLDAGRPGLGDLDQPLALARTTLGQSLPVTMGTVVKAYSVLAAHGRLPVEGSQQAVSGASADAVRQMLVEVVKRGTGQRAALHDVTVAGKTGTMVGDAPDAPILASFAGFAPAEAPKLVAFVVVEDAHASGGRAAAPIFREVMKEMLPLAQGAK